MICLYRQGSSHTIRGHKCEAKRFAVGELETKLKAGWFTSPADAYADQFDLNQSGKLSNEEIRKAARDAGIEKWKTARISKLKKELDLC